MGSDMLFNLTRRQALRHYCSAALALGAGLGLSAATALGAAHAAQTAKATQGTLLVVGDSLSAEYGLARGAGWVARLEERLRSAQPGLQVVNASISGDTTSGGRARLTALLERHHPSIVVIELGANDALRGLSLDATRDNLAVMARQSRQAGARVLLLGQQMPPNYGADYGRRFAALYVDVARAEKTGLVPFFLKGVADAPDARRLFQADGLHPVAEAEPRLLDNVWPELKKLF